MADGAALSKRLKVVVLAIWLPIFFYELAVWKRSFAYCAYEVLRVPDLSQRLDEFSLNRLIATMAAGSESIVIISFTIWLTIMFNIFVLRKSFVTDRANEMLLVPLMSERLYVITSYFFVATLAAKHPQFLDQLSSFCEIYTPVSDTLP
jgi:hypothetical protein